MNTYTCTDYRLEMILLGLNRKLNDPNVTSEERETLQREIQDIERKMETREKD